MKCKYCWFCLGDFKFTSLTKVKKSTYIGGKMQAIKIYSMRVAMLCRLYDLKLINDKEYTKIKNGWLYNQFVQLNKKMIHCESCVKI